MELPLIDHGLLVDCIARYITEHKVPLPPGDAELKLLRKFAHALPAKDRMTILNYVMDWPSYLGDTDREIQTNKLRFLKANSPFWAIARLSPTGIRFSPETLRYILQVNNLRTVLYAPMLDKKDIRKILEDMFWRVFDTLSPETYSEVVKLPRPLPDNVRIRIPFSQSRLSTKLGPSLYRIAPLPGTTEIKELSRTVETKELPEIDWSELIRDYFVEPLLEMTINALSYRPSLEGKRAQDEIDRITDVIQQYAGLTPEAQNEALADATLRLLRLGVIAHYSDPAIPIYRVLGLGLPSRIRAFIPGDIAEADYSSFVNNASQVFLQSAYESSPELLLEFNTYLLNQLTFDQLSVYYKTLVDQGMDLTHCIEESLLQMLQPTATSG